MSHDAVAKLVADQVYGHGQLAKDIMTDNSPLSWGEVVDMILDSTWLGKLHIDALARVHNTVIMTVRQTPAGTFTAQTFSRQYPTFGKLVASAQEIVEHAGPILLNQGNAHWVALAPGAPALVPGAPARRVDVRPP